MGDAATNRTLLDLNYQSDTYKLLMVGLFMGLVALLVLRTGALPRWLGWLGVVLSPLLGIAGWSFLLSTSLQYAAYAVLLVALLVWVAAVSVVSWRRAAARGAVPERGETGGSGNRYRPRPWPRPLLPACNCSGEKAP
jgi:hypothetical protein